MGVLSSRGGGGGGGGPAALTDDVVMAALATSLMRSEQTHGRAHAEGLRDALAGVQSELRAVAGELLGVQAAERARGRADAEVEGRIEAARAAADEAKREAAAAAAEAAARTADSERRLAASVAGVREQVAASATLLADAVAAAQQGAGAGAGAGAGGAGALSEAAQRLLVRQAVEGELGAPVRMLACDVAALKDEAAAAAAARRAHEEALAALRAQAARAPSPSPGPAGGAPADPAAAAAAAAVASQVSQLGETVAALSSELAELRARRGAAATLRAEDSALLEAVARGDDGDLSEEEGESAAAVAAERAVFGRRTGLLAPAFVATRSGGTARGATVSAARLAMAGDAAELSVGEVLLSESFEDGALVRVLPLT